jgi:hypothetical protein
MNKAIKLSNILGEIYSENFKGEWDEQYEISWEDLRTLAGGSLPDSLLQEVTKLQTENGFVLVPMEDVLVVAMESELSCRRVPGRIVNHYLNQMAEDDVRDDDIGVEKNGVEDELEAVADED